MEATDNLRGSKPLPPPSSSSSHSSTGPSHTPDTGLIQISWSDIAQLMLLKLSTLASFSPPTTPQEQKALLLFISAVIFLLIGIYCLFKAYRFHTRSPFSSKAKTH